MLTNGLVEDRIYRNGPKFSDRPALATNADPNQTAPTKELSDQGLYCLPFHLHLLDKLLYGKTSFL